MDGPRDYHTKQNKSEDKYHDITYMWNLKNDTNETETDSQLYRCSVAKEMASTLA